MSSQTRTERREVRSRTALPNARQQWIPRGSPVAQSLSSNSLNSSTNESSDQTLGPAVGNRGNSRAPRTPNVNVQGQNAISRHHKFQREGVSPSNNMNERVQNHYSSQEGILGPRNVDRQPPIASSSTRRGRPPSHRRESKMVEKNEARGQEKQFMAVNMDLPQRVQEIQEKLTKGTLECMICCDRVRRYAPIWSCPSCYAIFHLNCTKKWACAPTSIDLVAEKSQGFNWRCPLCQSVQLLASKEIHYLCFCGKRKDPPSDPYLTPHSCGEPCGKSLGASNDDLCPHVCVLQCHPGPCPPCKAFAPPRMCPCGKKVLTTRCSDQKSVTTCGQVCDKKLECQRHRCEQTCHLGPCDPCEVQLTASCFCMKKTESILCGEIAVKGEVDMNTGLFSCTSTCGKKLACGNHFCGEVCHPGPCGECELLPSRIKTCHCGQTVLQGNKRTSCLDPIPTCSKTCSKVLPCKAHHCKEVCHETDCPPCLEPVTQKCRCRSTSRTIECHISTSSVDRFVCEKPCGQKKNCGRHRCSERCCPLSSSINSNQDLHLCSIVCGKKLRCGQHSCQSLCHSGHCIPCLETIFSDLTCACGRTSIPPPLPCGTPLPSCQHPCSVPQNCGHQPSHNCHFGDCPPCPIPVAKECVGGHVVLRNIPCGSKDIKCNKKCGKTRQCGIHECARSCHSGPCDSESSSKGSCGQICGAPRRYCKHMCTSPCHPSSPCPDSRCEFSVKITCSCGRLTSQVPCSEDQRKLTCDEECVKAERKRVLADAFDVTPPNLDALHFGDSHGVSEAALIDFFRRDPKWVISVEERFKYMVMGKGRVGSNMKVHVFCPMVKEKRDVVRIMAERWKLKVSTAGWEPKRFVVVHVTPKSKAPARMMGAIGKGLSAPLFDPLVDIDPRLVVCLFELPSDADISALVLRFGGECELVWLNDKNALAVFSDPARAATAMRRLDRGSVYHGAAVVAQQGKSVVGATSVGVSGWRVDKADPWKKAVVEQDSWGEEEIASSSNSAPDSNAMETTQLTSSAGEVVEDWEKAYV